MTRVDDSGRGADPTSAARLPGSGQLSRARVLDSVLEAVGWTPIIALSRLPQSPEARSIVDPDRAGRRDSPGPEAPGSLSAASRDRSGWSGASILAKLESVSPGGSVKDRIAVGMILGAESRGRIRPGATVVEPTSGNTGVGLAMVCAVKGYRLILTMPDNMSPERRALLAAYGVKLELTPGPLAMKGAIDRARAILDATPDAFMPSQFENPDNPAVHYETTGVEILAQTEGRNVAAFVACVGTGGTLTGVAKRMRERFPGLEVWAVEPAESPVLSGGDPGPHGIQGIGAGFVPDALDTSLIDGVVTVATDQAVLVQSALARREGILAGISSGAAVAAALRVASALPPDRAVVTVLPDTGERYLSSHPLRV